MGLGKGAWRLALGGAEAESELPEAESEWNGSGKGCLALGRVRISCLTWACKRVLSGPRRSQNFLKQSQTFLRDMGLGKGAWRLAESELPA